MARPQLVTMQQVADRLGMSYDAVYKWWWRTQHDRAAIKVPMPDPVMTAGKKMLLWDWTDIEAWHERWRGEYRARMDERSEKMKEVWRAKKTESTSGDVESQ